MKKSPSRLVSGRGYCIPVVPPEFPDKPGNSYDTVTGVSRDDLLCGKSAFEPSCSKGKCANAVTAAASSLWRLLSVQTGCVFAAFFTAFRY